MASINITNKNITASSNTVTVSYTTDVTIDKIELTNNGSTYITASTFSQTSASFNISSWANGTYSSCKLRITYEIQDTYGNIVLNTTTVSLNEGSTGTFTVKLSQAPTSNQVVNISSSNSNVATINKTSLTFTPSNYSTAQSITVTGVKNSSNYSDQTCTITASSSVDSKTVNVTVKNTDTPPSGTTYGEIVLNKTSLSVNEGSTGTFTVKLASRPSTTQYVNLSCGNSNATINKASLTFTTSNYSTAQTVTVTGVRDSSSYSNKSCVITASSTGVSSKTVSVTIVNTDVEPEPPNTEIPTRLIGVNRSVWSYDTDEFCRRFRELKINELTLSCMFDIPSLTANTVSVNSTDVNRCKAIMTNLKSDGTWNKIKVIFEPYPYINSGNDIETGFSPSNMTTFLNNWGTAIKNTLNTHFSGENFFGIYVNSNMDNLKDSTTQWQNLYNNLKSSFPNTNIMVRTNFWWSNDDAPEYGGIGLNTRKTHAYYKIWDILAIAAYFELGDENGTPSASTDEIYNWIVNGTITWDRGQKIKEECKSLAQALGVKIFFGELNMPSRENAVSWPYDNSGTVEDLQTQKNFLEAYTRAFIEDSSTESWFLGYSVYALGDYNIDQDTYDLYSLRTNSIKPAGTFIKGLNVINTYPVS